MPFEDFRVGAVRRPGTLVGLKAAALDSPAFVPRTTGRRQELTGTAGASNPQVRNQYSAIAAGSEICPVNTLKVETRAQIPLGLQP